MSEKIDQKCLYFNNNKKLDFICIILLHKQYILNLQKIIYI